MRMFVMQLVPICYGWIILLPWLAVILVLILWLIHSMLNGEENIREWCLGHDYDENNKQCTGSQVWKGWVKAKFLPKGCIFLIYPPWMAWNFFFHRNNELNAYAKKWSQHMALLGTQQARMTQMNDIWNI